MPCNTHRLLIRGSRIPYEEAVEVAEELEIKPQIPLTQKMLMLGIGAIFLVWLIVTMIRIVRWIKERKKAKENDHVE